MIIKVIQFFYLIANVSLDDRASVKRIKNVSISSRKRFEFYLDMDKRGLS